MQDADLDRNEADAVDRTLALRALAGEQMAMRELVERHQAMVLRLSERMLGNRHDAEDVVQETFVRALKSLARWDSERAFRPWLLAIAANRCRTALGKRKPQTFDQQLLGDHTPARPDHGERLQRLTEEVELALAEVRDECRAAFEHFHYDQLAYAEIAEVLGAPVGTIKTWIHRARREVAERLIRRGVVERVTSDVSSDEVSDALPTGAATAASFAR